MWGQHAKSKTTSLSQNWLKATTYTEVYCWEINLFFKRDSSGNRWIHGHKRPYLWHSNFRPMKKEPRPRDLRVNLVGLKHNKFPRDICVKSKWNQVLLHVALDAVLLQRGPDLKTAFQIPFLLIPENTIFFNFLCDIFANINSLGEHEDQRTAVLWNPFFCPKLEWKQKQNSSLNYWKNQQSIGCSVWLFAFLTGAATDLNCN